MRITIETTEQAGLATPIHEPKSPPSVETMDGGIPSEALVHAIAESLPATTESRGMNAGSPPEWLVQAIQGTAQLNTTGSDMDTDAGSAPSSEG